MKKTIALISAILMAASLTGCGGKKDKETPITESTVISKNEVNDTPVKEEVVLPFEEFFASFINNDPEKLIKCTTPQVYIDKLKETEGAYEALVEENQERIDVTVDYWNELYGDNLSARFNGQIENTTLTAQQLELAELCIKYTFYDLNVDLELEEGYEVRFNYITEGSKDKVEDEETACFVRAKGDSWIMLGTDAESLESYKGAKDPTKE